MKHLPPIASLSFDLDNQWSYMKTHGDPGWETFPSYFDRVVPRVLNFLQGQNLEITFFIVGQDAALEKNHPAIQSIAAAGHEIGNHSFSHEPWLHIYSAQQIEDDIASAEEHLEKITGQRPIGFRGPGYSLSQTALNVLKRRGYLYDASTLPTYIGPLARMYYFMSTRLSPEQKRQRALLFGRFREGFQPIKPYCWTLDGDAQEELIEIPLTTMPILKIPIHVSYLLYIYLISPKLAELYFQIALKLCKLTAVQPSLLLHPLDFLGCDDVQELAFFPGMNLPYEKKIQFVRKVIGVFTQQYAVVPLRKYAQQLAKTSVLPAGLKHRSVHQLV
jgi:peptidoglycan-N-acetylglucosamine deacetylase